MINVNGKEIDLNKTPSEAKGVEKAILEEIQRIKKMYAGKFPIKFNYLPKMFFDREVVNKSKTVGHTIKRSKPAVAIRARRDVVINGVRQEVQYFESVRTSPKTGKPVYFPKNITLYSHNSFDESDIDLVFYLLTISPNIVSTYKSDVIDKVKPQYAPKYLQLVDEVQDAKTEVARMRAVSAFEYKLTNELEDNEIRDIALFYSIDNKSDIDIVRTKLRQKVELLDKEKAHVDAYSEFMENIKKLRSKDAGYEEEVNIKSLIEKSFRDKKLQWDGNKCYLYEDGEQVEVLCTRAGRKTKEETIYERVEIDKDLMDKLRQE